VLGNEPPGHGGMVGGPGGVRSPWSRDPEGEIEPAMELEGPLPETEAVAPLLAAEGTSSSRRACRLTEGFSLQVLLCEVLEVISKSNEDVEAIASTAAEDVRSSIVFSLSSAVLPRSRLRWSSEAALRGSPRSRRRPNSLDASNDLWPDTYLARERQNLHRPLLLLGPDGPSV